LNADTDRITVSLPRERFCTEIRAQKLIEVREAATGAASRRPTQRRTTTAAHPRRPSMRVRRPPLHR